MPRRVLMIACGALVREVRAVIAQLPPDLVTIDVEYLPAPFHNRPDRIEPAVRFLIESKRHEYDHIALGYADCGTGGALDRVVEEYGVSRLPGAHCYEFFAGGDVFASLHDEEPGTFYLTDYLARHFDSLVVGSLGLDRHPHLRDAYFGNYRRLCYLAQTNDPELLAMAQRAASVLALEFIHRATTLAPFSLALAGTIRTPGDDNP